MPKIPYLNKMNLTRISRKIPAITVMISVLAPLLFFTGVLNEFLNKIIVEDLISKYDNSNFNGIVLTLLTIIITWWLYVYGSRMFKRQLAIGVTVFYALFISSQFWNYYTLKFYPEVRCFDVIVIGILVAAVLPNRKNGGVTTAESSDGFLEDLPINSLEEDSFGRQSIAKEIAQKINMTKNKKSFAIGILGEYGSGKTSFINLVKANLDNSKITTIEFNPWGADGKSNIQQDFFDLLSSRLYKEDPKISGLILSYSRKLARTGSSIEKVFRQTQVFGSLFHDSNFVEDYDKIDKMLSSLDKKIVVVIDDVDRLYSEEVLEVFRMIRNTANFSNIFYLTAYDRTYVNEAVNSINQGVNSSYLDKIIQMEVPLPKRENNDLQVQLGDYLEAFLKTEDMEVYLKYIIPNGFDARYDHEYSKVFRQSRDIIKFINSFKLIYGRLQGEVFFENLFVLELLKFRFPLVYDRLYENKKDFIAIKNNYFALENQYYELHTTKESKQDNLTITDSLRKEQEYSEPEIKLISGLVHHLFFSWERTKESKNSIIHPMFFERYFRYRIAGKEISEKRFNTALQGGIEQMKSLIESSVELGMARQTAARLLQFKPSDKEGFELMVRSLFLLGPLYASKEGLRSFQFDSLVDLLRNSPYNPYVNFYKKKPDELKQLTEKLFEGSFPFLFENEMMYHIRKSTRDFSLSDEELTDRQIKYFNAHLEKEGLSEDAVYILYWTSDERLVPAFINDKEMRKERRIKDKMAVRVLEVLPNYDLLNFLKMSIYTDFRDKSARKINWTFLALFSEPAELRKAVSSNKNISRNVKKEYLQFFDACKENGFDRLTEFELKTDLKNRIETSIDL